MYRLVLAFYKLVYRIFNVVLIKFRAYIRLRNEKAASKVLTCIKACILTYIISLCVYIHTRLLIAHAGDVDSTLRKEHSKMLKYYNNSKASSTDPMFQ